ncbi:hypothetical protein F5B19DRAFT_493346 [Rostrohypoxylon terebratum]|nr:hypothetical protein F5B19DRAFT_493346 [Rostrohypoxylon terebratum]
MASNQDQASVGAEVEHPKRHFPPELATAMIRSSPDYMMPYIWCTFRLVCKAWKAETEKAFREIYLPKVKLMYKFGVFHVEGQYYFDRLSEDDAKERAFFRLDSTKPASPLQDQFGSMIERPMSTLYRPDSTMHFAVVDNVAISDTALESVLVDLKNKEVSFLWMPMMNQLMSEEVHFRREACKAVDLGYGKSKEAATQVDADFEAGRKKIAFFMAQRDLKFFDVINQARESRLRKQYRICGDTFISLKDHDKLPNVSYIIFKTRKRFRTPGYLLEL